MYLYTRKTFSSSGDSNFNKSKICSEWRISITNM